MLAENKSINYNDLPKMTAYQYWKYKNHNFLEDISIIKDDIKINNKESIESIECMTKSLRELGVRKGDVITMGLLNSPELINGVRTLSKTGTIGNMVSPNFDKNL